MQRFVLRFGLIAGGIMSAMLLATMPFQDRIGLDYGQIIGYASMVGAFLFVFAAVRAYRDAAPGRTVSFGRALAVGTLVVLVASACYTVTWEVAYFGYYRGSYTARMQEHMLAKLRAEGATPAQVEARRAELERFAAMYDNPAVNAAITFLEPLPVGLLMALAAAGLLRRRRPAGAAPELARAR